MPAQSRRHGTQPFPKLLVKTHKGPGNNISGLGSPPIPPRPGVTRPWRSGRRDGPPAEASLPIRRSEMPVCFIEIQNSVEIPMIR